MVVEVKAYKCEECGKVYLDEKVAISCCEQRYCYVCEKPVSKYKTRCETCNEKHTYEKANKIKLEDYKGEYVYSMQLDRYFSINELDYMFEVFDDIECEYNGYVFACDTRDFNFDIDGALESYLEDWYEDASDDINYWQELTDFMKQWNDKQGMKCYGYTIKTIIMIDRENY